MRVLIVDDNADLAGALEGVLTQAPLRLFRDPPIEVRTASRGSEALELARKTGFDVAIVDVKLPDASGVDLIGPLREASPGSEVVLITGFASMDAAIGALRAGAFALILKSFRPEELVATVEQALTKVRLQRERTELEHRYRALVDLTDVLVVGIDGLGKVVLFNQKAAHTAGTSDAVGRDFVDTFIPEPDRPKMREAIAAAGSSDRPRDAETGFLAHEAGVARGLPMRVRWHLSGARDPDGTPLVYGIGIDVTERRALEKRAADAEALSAMSALALNLAHEIRNPLNAAVLQLHLLRRDVDKLDEATRTGMHKRVDIVGDEVARLSRLLTDFLELARPRDAAREPVHMGELAHFVLDLERDAAEARGVKIVRDIHADGCVAIADSAKLKQVVINLVVNALEAMKEGGTLTVAVRGDGDRVLVDVGDTGPGIDPAILGSVFDPFFTTKEAGTGLGLSIVRKIVDQHAGDVRIVSRPGEGTHVLVTIPMARSIG
jgi:PAS domain S-box-containing protein